MGRIIEAGRLSDGSVPCAARTPHATHCERGCVMVRSAWSHGSVCGTRTSCSQGSPRFQPRLTRKLAAEASVSGTLWMRSRRPSPSKSTAFLR